MAHDDSVAMFLIVTYPLACLPRVRPVGLYYAARSPFEATKYQGYDIPFPPHEIRPTVKAVVFFFLFFFSFENISLISLSLIAPPLPPFLPPFLPPSFLSSSAPRAHSSSSPNEHQGSFSRANPTSLNPSLTHSSGNGTIAHIFSVASSSWGEGGEGKGWLDFA